MRNPTGYAAPWPATTTMDSVGLGNVDARLRSAFGDDYGLVVETAPGSRHEGYRSSAQVRPRSALMNSSGPTPLRVLVVDDERPALDELAWLLQRDARVGVVTTSDSAAEALRVLQEGGVDAVFTDIRMPGLTGLELARVLSRFRSPPPVVFMTAYDDHAVDAFELNAVDYVLKPVREDRLAEAVRRVCDVHGDDSPPSRGPDTGRARRRHQVHRALRRAVRGGAR